MQPRVARRAIPMASNECYSSTSLWSVAANSWRSKSFQRQSSQSAHLCFASLREWPVDQATHEIKAVLPCVEAFPEARRRVAALEQYQPCGAVTQVLRKACVGAEGYVKISNVWEIAGCDFTRDWMLGWKDIQWSIFIPTCLIATSQRCLWPVSCVQGLVLDAQNREWPSPLSVISRRRAP